MVEVRPRIPPELSRLEELANDLWYSWSRPAREIFSRLHPALWETVRHSPRAFLRHVDEDRLNAAAREPGFRDRLARTLALYDAYRADHAPRGEAAQIVAAAGPVAYFCAEFGLHESFPMYSGGLGILAGDHCKAASDQRLPFVGVGLLYRQGYFEQALDGHGNQLVQYNDSDFEHLPITLLRRPDGQELRVAIALPGRAVILRVWEARAGHVRLFLLDTDHHDNDEADRDITHRLYGGDRVHRLEQEIVLGIGGVRALAAVGIKPSVWHINEGHAAFLILERTREMVAHGIEFDTALEAVAAGVVFTTHTAVPAGHDRFDLPVMEQYFEDFCRDAGIDRARLLALGASPEGPGFNMTSLAVRGSRSRNGVSRVHAEVSSRMLQAMWPQVEASENPVGHVTNGVHVPTFLAPEWTAIFEAFIGPDWALKPEREFADRLDELPIETFWNVHQQLKARMLHLVRRRMRQRHMRNHGSEPHLDRMLALSNPANLDILTIGFARRFATYKRAALLFDNLDWLHRLACDEKRPVVLVFAGKAHPADGPGQDVIRHIAQTAARPEFEGRILLVEGYDLHLSRRLVSGVDVWLNNPVYPLEASGTSGMKAGMNGVLNLSVLDGWWAEGYTPGNGWAIRPAASGLDPQSRDREEARTLYEILEDEVIPLYYDRDAQGRPGGWVSMAKRSIATLLPAFSAKRMLGDYLERFYVPACRQGERFLANGLGAAQALQGWKRHVAGNWPHVEVRWLRWAPDRVVRGEGMQLEAAVKLGGLSADDVRVELILERPSRGDSSRERDSRYFSPADEGPQDGWQKYVLQLDPSLCGQLEYRLRVYPFHHLLAHRFEMGLTTWA